ncbi:hypothetical protein SPLA5a_PHROGS00197 [Salmonella phage SPLA5a]|nr:hypothetical protein SPLA5a_PHROGS00197 [Salmonella phage SPLA5a]
MALIVSVTRAVKDKPLKAQCETLIFEDEEQGRQYVEEHATFVFSVQKARIVKNGKTETQI